MNMGKLISLLRTAQGLSQTGLASELSITRAYLSQVENGHKEPSLVLLRKIAEFFDIPLAVLLADENETDPLMMDELKRMLGEVLVIKLSMAEHRNKSGKKKSKSKLKA